MRQTDGEKERENVCAFREEDLVCAFRRERVRECATAREN